MSISQADVQALVTGEQGDLATFGAVLARFVADVDALLATSPTSPDFTQLAASVTANRATIGTLLGEIQTEDTKIAPPAPAPAPATS